MLSQLFEQVTSAILHHSNQQQETGFDPSNLLSHVQELFGQHAATTGQPFLPASQDPYGDPASQGGGGRFGNIRPASQDPYGDPADR
jgi:hypothetical protein